MSKAVRRRSGIAVLLGIALMVSASTSAQVARSVKTHRNRDIALQKSRDAATALFERSDLKAARTAAQQVLRPPKHSLSSQGSVHALIEALFVEMEAASLQADTSAELYAALRLCEVSGQLDDPRVSIASSRILELSANTSAFRAAVPRIRALLAVRSPVSSDLRAALLAAAADGAPGLSVSDIARESGLITDWKIAGPIAEFPNVAFEQVWEPERDGLSRKKYSGHYVENFQFSTGEVAIPDYMTESGIYYAAGQMKLAAGGTWLLRIESPGTIQVWIDGTLMLTKDDRFRASPEALGVNTNLRAGTHHVLVKFLPSAVPFRVAVVPSAASPGPNRPPPLSESESAYIAAEKSFWSGDYASASELLVQLRATHHSAPVDVLLAKSRMRSGENTSDCIELLESALRLALDAHAAEQELASIRLRKGEFKDALEAANAVIAAHPRSEPAVRVLAAAASRLGQIEVAKRAFAIATEIHPSCTELKDAAAFFESISDLEQASAYESRLRNCAPGSLAWPEALARRGLHPDSAAALQQILDGSPLNRDVRKMLVHELILAGKEANASEAADELVSIAPNSIEFRKMAATLHADGAILDSTSADSLSFDDQFYVPYRRDGIELVNQTVGRKFSGGPLAILLDDHIAEVKPSGEAFIYVHQISRVLDRYGINRYGEVTVPKDASLLELRTIKADGSIVEPEFNQHKSTISMPALAPGDAIDLEYVVHLEAGLACDPELFQFTFGSFSAPTVFSRVVTLTPANSNTRFELSGSLPPVRVITSGSTTVRTWEANDIAQFNSENSMPRSGILPSIRLITPENRGWAGVSDFYRDTFIDAVQESSRIQNLAGALTGSTTEQRLRAAYKLVVSRVTKADTDYESGDIASADSTLANYSGSRAALLLALAKAMGIEGRVLMARDISLRAPEIATPHAYSHPLLLFRLPEKGEIVLDPETTGMIFGGVSATLETRDALIVPVYRAEDDPQITSIPKPSATERSTATGDVRFNSNGDLTAHIEIRMGAARGAQMRTTLHGINPSGRKRFFEQLASRIFPGVTKANGEVQNETNTDDQLVLIVDCQATRFADLSKATAQLDQLVPALGLKRMYATDGSRKWPLLVDTPLFESSTFRISLPEGTRFAPLFSDVSEQNKFGSYSVTFRMMSPTTVEVRREFDIPVQIIPQEQFSSFTQFARIIDEAEHPHLIVRR